MPKSSKSQEARNLNLGPKVSRMTPLYKFLSHGENTVVDLVARTLDGDRMNGAASEAKRDSTPGTKSW